MNEGWDDLDEFDESAVDTAKSTSITFSEPLESSGLRHRRNSPETVFRKSAQQQQEDSGDSFLAELSAEKRLLLERENEALLEEFESGLDQIRQEYTCRSIFDTQVPNVQDRDRVAPGHLESAKSNEKIIEDMHEEAWQATEHIEAANVYLKNSKQLFEQSRKWLLVFFVVASLSVLFLDWYYG
ncbi:hypothetical protein HDU83_003231 [Entophlyctis luteolus]|nr:hypothetical protein HDU83_003231 [Entophlyctis luteolus]